MVRHKQLAYHICALSAVFFLHWYLATLGQYLALSYVSTPHCSEYAVFATNGALLVTGLCIPLGPRLYQDLSRMYSKAVTAKIEKEGQVPTPNTHNVNEEVSSSIFGQLAVSFVFPVISKTSSMDQVDMTDLPAPQAFFRTQNILHESVQVDDQGGLRSAWGPTIALLWTVWAPQWRSVLKGKLRIVVHGLISVQASDTCLLFVRCGISLISVFNRFCICSIMEWNTAPQSLLQSCSCWLVLASSL